MARIVTTHALNTEKDRNGFLNAETGQLLGMENVMFNALQEEIRKERDEKLLDGYLTSYRNISKGRIQQAGRPGMSRL